jgi:hypothetical protein
MKYYCYTARSLPYIAGTFANVIVEVDDATNAVLSIAPLTPDTTAMPEQPLISLEADVVSSALPNDNKES